MIRNSIAALLLSGTCLSAPALAQGLASQCQQTPRYFGCLPSATALLRTHVLPLSAAGQDRNVSIGQLLGQMVAQDVTAALGYKPLAGDANGNLPASSISGLAAQVAPQIAAAVATKLDAATLGQPNGPAALDTTGKVPAASVGGLPELIASQTLTSLAGKLGVTGDGSGVSVTLPGMLQAVSLASYFASLPVPVEACGAKGDGTTDDAPAIELCGNTFGNLRLGGKPYALKSNITWSTKPVVLNGAGWSDLPSEGGTRLLIGQTSAYAIAVSGAARGSEFRDLAIVQPQPTPAAGWAPTQYPCVFGVRATAGRVEFHNILMAPVYDGICAQGAGRLVLDGLYGQPLHRGVTIDTAYDTTHVGRVHFWPYWSSQPDVMAWQQQNGDAFLLGRVDGLTAPDVFTYGYRSSLHFQATADGSASKIDVGVLYADANKWPIWIQGGNDQFGLHAAAHIGSMWADGEQLGPNATPARGIPGGAAILVDADSRADLVVDQFDAAFFEGSPVRLASTLAYTTLRFGTFNARYYNVLNDGSPAIYLSPTIDPQHYNDIALATPPILAPSFPSPLVTSSTRALFSWPGFASSQLDVQHAVSGQVFETPGYTRGLAVYADTATTLDANTWRLPAFPVDGQVATFVSPQNMTGLTVVPSPSGPAYPVNGQPAATLFGYTGLSYRFSAARQAWLLGGL